MSVGSSQNMAQGDFPYPSRRVPLIAARGVVAASQPLAAQAGLSMLQRGGNAVDAAIASAVALTVLEPIANGIGGDAFALVWDGNQLHGLNGSGRAPLAHSLDLFASLGLREMPNRGWLPVTVPGAPAAWRELHGRFGKLPFEVLFEPAISYAEEGFPVAPEVAEVWSEVAQIYAAGNPGADVRGWADTFAPDGRVPHAGSVWSLPGHARTLRELAETGVESFYRGKLAVRIAAFAEATGGYLTRADLAAHTSTWVKPIHTSYRGHEIWEIPPNGQGIAALLALDILEGFDLARYPRESADSYHLQIEAMKLAFADAQRYVSDPEHSSIPVSGLLDKSYAAGRRALIGERALLPSAGAPLPGGTVYLCAADRDGMMVSFIQSNFRGWLLGFGSGIVVPDTGIALHSRGTGFSLEAGHPNVVAPGKRPLHTIVPAFMTRQGKAVGPFGIMGGNMQPQGHVQLVVNQVDYRMNPQASLDAPRWQWQQGMQVALEVGVPQHVMHGLDARGHLVSSHHKVYTFGKGQIIRRLDSGAYIAGSEPRSDGHAVGY